MGDIVIYQFPFKRPRLEDEEHTFSDNEMQTHKNKVVRND